MQCSPTQAHTDRDTTPSHLLTYLATPPHSRHENGALTPIPAALPAPHATGRLAPPPRQASTRDQSGLGQSEYYCKRKGAVCCGFQGCRAGRVVCGVCQEIFCVGMSITVGTYLFVVALRFCACGVGVIFRLRVFRVGVFEELCWVVHLVCAAELCECVSV